MKLDGCTALITGASAGLGREFARQLAASRQRRWSSSRVARTGSSNCASELSRPQSEFKLQLREPIWPTHNRCRSYADGLQRDGIAIDLLINNAGVGDRGSFATSTPDRVNAMLEVNVVALTMLTRALLPSMRERKRGAVLNVSSCASFLPMPGFAVYAATKAYVTSFSDALGGELRGSGVSVSALCPGPVHTEFDTVALRPDEPAQKAPEFTYVSPEEVVRAALLGIEADRARVVPGVVMKVAMLFVRLMPMPLMRAAWRVSPR